MAEWLNQQSKLPVRLAKEGDRPRAGTVLLAGTNDHLLLKAPDRLGYAAEPKDYVYRPSVDVFFQSVNLHWPGEAAGVLLTGMGRDGALGLKEMRDEGSLHDRAGSGDQRRLRHAQSRCRHERGGGYLAARKHRVEASQRARLHRRRLRHL